MFTKLNSHFLPIHRHLTSSIPGLRVCGVNRSVKPVSCLQRVHQFNALPVLLFSLLRVAKLHFHGINIVLYVLMGERGGKVKSHVEYEHVHHRTIQACKISGSTYVGDGINGQKDMSHDRSDSTPARGLIITYSVRSLNSLSSGYLFSIHSPPFIVRQRQKLIFTFQTIVP